MRLLRATGENHGAPEGAAEQRALRKRRWRSTRPARSPNTVTRHGVFGKVTSPAPSTSIAQTRDGYLGVGTDGGLLRYDGVRFELWIPPDAVESPNRVALLGASDGSLWIGTLAGLAQWHPRPLHSA